MSTLRQDKHCTKLDFKSYQKLLTSSPGSPPQETPLSDQKTQLHTPIRPNYSSDVEKREPAPSSKDNRKIVGGAPRNFGLPQICEEGTTRQLIIREESPWDTYRRSLKCTLAGDVIIAARRSRPSAVIAIRKYIEGDMAKMRRMYDILDHDNVLTARECFIYEECLYALVDDLPLTLEHLVGCRFLYPTETELASMVWQLLGGLCYLNEIGLEHQALTCRNVLFGLDGVVKIASLEMCVERPPGQVQSFYIKTLASMTMEIMQKYEKEDGMVGVDDVERWPVDSDAFGFLSALLTTKSIECLKEQPLLRRKSRLVGELVLLARSVLVSARIFYSYEK